MIERLRAAGISGKAIGALGGLLLLVYAFLPRSSPFGAGMDLGQFLLEVLPAAFVGVGAICLVLIYRTVRIINFAQVAFGVVAQLLFYEFYTRQIFPYWLAWPVGIIGGTLITIIIGIILSTLFFRYPRLTLTVVTVFMTGIIRFAADEIQGAFVQPGEILQIDPVPLAGSFWDSTLITVGVVPIRIAHLVGFLAIAASLIGLAIFFRRTRMGIAVRASAENDNRAALLGINVKLINVGVWGIVGLLTSIAAVAKMPVSPYVPGGAESFDGLLPALAAAVLARFASLPTAFLVGFGIHIAQTAVFIDLEDNILLTLLLFVAVLVGLLLQRRQGYSRVEDASSWRVVREVRPTPTEMLQLGAIRTTRRMLWLIMFGALLALPWVIANDTLVSLSLVWPTAIVIASLVILVGWTGQMSLGHMALVGAGALAAANITMTLGWSFWIALPAGGVAGAALATLIGIPALRIRGLFLAVATFALGIAFPALLFNNRYLASWVPVSVDSPDFFGHTFDSGKFRYYFLFVLFLLVAFAVKRLRASRAGRLLIALRDNEAGVQSFGVDVVRTRLMAFAISGFLAGIAGAVLVHVNRGMDQFTFGSEASFFIFLLAIVGGISSVSGAVLGALLLTLGRTGVIPLFGLLIGVGGLVLIMTSPGGLAQIIFGLRDAVLRVVALRKHMVVPSLFADYSPEAWEKRLTPLAPTVPSQGLSALPTDQRYALPSRLYGKVSA